MLWYLFFDIICSYPSIFSRQVEAFVYLCNSALYPDWLFSKACYRHIYVEPAMSSRMFFFFSSEKTAIAVCSMLIIFWWHFWPYCVTWETIKVKCRGSKILQSKTKTLQLFVVAKYVVKVKTQERLDRIKNGFGPTFPPLSSQPSVTTCYIYFMTQGVR